MKLLVINGPNINMLGVREKDIYGDVSYKGLVDMINEHCKEKGVFVDCYQSNHEGDIVDKIQSAYQKVDAIVINPAAYTHTSVAIFDALKSVNIPTVEVHISDISSREDFRKHSFIKSFCVKSVINQGLKGYINAIDYIINYVEKS